MEEFRKRQLVSGLTLIGVGIALYALIRAQEHMGPHALLIVIGGAFLSAYFYFREYGYLVPGCLMLGFALGRIWGASSLAVGNPTMIGLGLGFIAIYVIGLLYERRAAWWPLAPGSVLLLLGIPLTTGLVEYLFDNWPLILVLVGLILVIGAFVRRAPGRA